MTLPAVTFSDDQAEAWDRVADMLAEAGVHLSDGHTEPAHDGPGQVMAVMGKAGSGKTLLLSELCKALGEAGNLHLLLSY